MRLTLRTLLAYMDDILEPAQAKEIGQKISESAYASELAKRIKEVMRRRRVSAPDLDGAAVDSNLIAEYLDNALPPEAVAEIEKICLESDVQLAEAAACHQILTLVMGEPINVPAESRQRMYALGPVSSETALQAAEPRPEPQPAAAAEPTPTTRPAADFHATVPDYLRRQPTWKRAAPYLLAAVVIAAWIGLLYSDKTFFPAQSGEQQEIASEDGEPAAERDAGVPPQPAPDGQPGQPGQKKPADTGTPAGPPLTAGIDPEPPADEPGTGLTGTPTTAVPPSSQPADTTEPTPTVTTPTITTPTVAATDTVTENPPTPQPTVPAADTEPETTTTTAGAPVATPPQPAEPSGPLLINETDEGIVLVQANGASDWLSVTRNSQQSPGTRLAVPEPFTGALRIEGVECRITLQGGTRLQYMGESSAGSAGFRLEQGAMRLDGVGLPLIGPDDKPFAFGFDLGGRLYRLELMTDDSRCGLEVTPRQPTRPLQDFGLQRCRATLTVAQGAVRIADGQTVTVVQAGQQFVLQDYSEAASAAKTASDDPATEAAAQPPASEPAAASPAAVSLLPEWLQSVPASDSAISSRYRNQFQALFRAGEPVQSNVAPLIRDPDPRMAEMAMHCLSLIQDVSYMVSALQQTDHQDCRVAAIEGIRDWLPLSPQNDEILRNELNRNFPESEASLVHRMLWGYGPEDAANQFAALSIVDALEHEHIAVRELGFYYLRKLTGRKFEYRPNALPVQRAASVKRLRMQVLRDQGLPGAVPQQ